MNFQQLRSIREAARRGYNLTEVANVLFTSQPGVSRQIRELEEELGVEIFERNGKRLVGLTEPGKGILQIIDRLLLEAQNRKLDAKNLELQTELLKLKGLGAEQLALRLAELEQQLATRNKMLFGPSSEKRNKRSKDGQPEKPQKGHGPTEQPKLRLI